MDIVTCLGVWVLVCIGNRAVVDVAPAVLILKKVSSSREGGTWKMLCVECRWRRKESRFAEQISIQCCLRLIIHRF